MQGFKDLQSCPVSPAGKQNIAFPPLSFIEVVIRVRASMCVCVCVCEVNFAK